MASSAGEVQQLIKEVRRNGFTVEIGDGGIGKVLWHGEQVYKHEQDGGTPVTIHATPSDHRWRKNLVPILIRAKVLERDPFSNHTEKKIVLSHPPMSSFITNQLEPWIKRRLDEGFNQSSLSRAISKNFPAVGSPASAQTFMSSVLRGKKKRLTSKTYEAWKEVIEGWSKRPALPPKKRGQKAEPEASGNGNGQVVELPKRSEERLTKPSIPLSARTLAMMMDSYPDRDEALLLHLELVELEERVYS